jgi:hypothetical protein
VFRQLQSVVSPRRSAVLALTLGALLLVPAGPTPGQGVTGKDSGGFLTQAFVRVTDNAELTKRITGYGYADGVSVLAAWVDRGDSVAFIRPLSANISYMFLAAGDRDAQIVNLEILDVDGRNVLKNDGKSQPDAILEFTPTVSTSYRMRLTLAKSDKNLPCMCVAAILKKDGWKVPLGSLDTCAKKITDTLATVDAEVRRLSGKKLDFYKAKNQWALYGGVLKENETLQIDNLALGRGIKGFIAVGDNNTSDVDLFLLDQFGNTVKEDVRPDPEASFVHEPGPQKHSLRVLNYKATGPSLIFMSTFDVLPLR